ncbi:serine O-acetyltransferase [Methyloligella solikamskensis]|uniref:Serine acetyltransferase n=1 Tax=Methyloligella solikamskensis TaxID=1177756 RepID=A0ABW3J9N7_9HYPH
MHKTAAARRPELKRVDPIWSRLQDEAEQVRANEPALAGFVYATILSHASLEDALCHRLSQRLQHTVGDAGLLNRTFLEVIEAAPEVGEDVRADLAAWATRDPACERVIEPLLYFKGFHALETYRLSHILWHMGRRDLALYLQSQASRVFAVDIHPAAQIGKGIMIDHATGIVIGETAVVGDNCSLLHGVTLGGTGNESGDRHPKIGTGVMLGAGAKVLGNIKIGDCVRVAAGSVVLKDVPARRTVAGVPAREIGFAGCEEPAIAMDQFVAGIVDDADSE